MQALVLRRLRWQLVCGRSVTAVSLSRDAAQAAFRGTPPRQRPRPPAPSCALPTRRAGGATSRCGAPASLSSRPTSGSFASSCWPGGRRTPKLSPSPDDGIGSAAAAAPASARVLRAPPRGGAAAQQQRRAAKRIGVLVCLCLPKVTLLAGASHVVGKSITAPHVRQAQNSFPGQACRIGDLGRGSVGSTAQHCCLVAAPAGGQPSCCAASLRPEGLTAAGPRPAGPRSACAARGWAPGTGEPGAGR